MKRNSKRWATAAGALVVAGLLGAPSAGATAPAGELEEVKLGLIVPSSGTYASIGTSFERSMELFLEQHDNLLGGHPVKVVKVDEGAGASEALPGARQLIEQDQVDLVTGIVSGATAAAVFPLFDEAQIPVIGAQGYPYPDVMTEDVSPFLWNAGGSNPPFSVSMALHMAENVDPETGVYFMSSDYVGGRALLDEAMAAYEGAGGTIAGTAYPPLGTTLDFQPYLSQLRDSGATAVYVFFAGADAVRFVQQFNDFGLKDEVQIYSTGGLVTADNLEALGSAAEGILTNSNYTTNLENPQNEQFVADFSERFGVVPDDYEARMWDAMNLIDLALAGVEELTPEAIADGLMSVEPFLSPRGTCTIDPVTHVATLPMNLWVVVETDSGGYTNEFVEELGTFDPATGQPL